jgi:NAD(P) transhydrogenase subunit alpha
VVQILAFIAILIASINIAGGFLVSQRMLKMFSK